MWRNKKSLFHRATSGLMACVLTTISAINPLSTVPAYATENWANLSYQNINKEDVQIYIQSESESFASEEEVSLKIFVQNNTDETFYGGTLSMADHDEFFSTREFIIDQDGESEEHLELNEKGNIENITIAPGEVFEAELIGTIADEFNLTKRADVNFIFKAQSASENEIGKVVKYDFNTGFVTFLPIESGDVIAAGETGKMTFRILLDQEEYDIEVDTETAEDEEKELATDSNAELATDSNAELATSSNAELATDSNAKFDGNYDIEEYVQKLKKVNFLVRTYDVQFHDVNLTEIQAYQTMNGLLELEAIAEYTIDENVEVGKHFGTVAAEVKVGKKTYKVSQVFEYEVEEKAPEFTEEQMAQVQNVMDLIAKLPTMDEYFVAIEKFFFDDDTISSVQIPT